MRQLSVLTFVLAVFLAGLFASRPISTLHAGNPAAPAGSTPTGTSTLTATPTETPIATNTSTSTSTPTTTDLASDTPTNTPTATPTDTPTPTHTPTPTQTPTPTITGTRGAWLPQVYRQPTWTPTPTPSQTGTPTQTRTPAATSTNSLPCGSGSTLTGQLALVENKPTYATYIERIKFNEWIYNPTCSTINFGVLGVTTTGPQLLPFQTSWSGELAGGGVLQIFAGCHGPAGIPCASSSDAGRHEDHIGDGPEESANNEIRVPGNYQMFLMVCLSPFSACTTPGAGDWRQLSGPVGFTAIQWTPGPGGLQATPEPSTQYGCFLITDDPRGTYLKCITPKLRGRPLHR